MGSKKFFYTVNLFFGIFMIVAVTLCHFPALLDLEGSSSLAKETMRVLSEMNIQLENASQVLVAKSDQLLFLDRNHQLQEYCFEYDALWHNDYPLIKSVASFNFEYRDITGYQLTSTHQASDLHTIGYTLRMEESRQPLIACHSVNIDQVIHTNVHQKPAVIASVISFMQ